MNSIGKFPKFNPGKTEIVIGIDVIGIDPEGMFKRLGCLFGLP
jgi:hypothetical protein